MTLHEAIEEVLVLAKYPLNSNELAEVININSLYKRRDGLEVTPTQITARVNQYPDIFKVENKGITLIDKAIISFKKAYFNIFNTLKSSALTLLEIREIALTTIFITWQRDETINEIHGDDQDLLAQIIAKELHFLDDNLNGYAVKMFKNLNRHHISFIINELNQVGGYDKPSKELFGDFFNDIVNEYTNVGNSRSGEHSSPKILSEFVSSFFSTGDEGVIFDPFAGNCSSLIQTAKKNHNKHPRIIGNDINQSACFIGALNLAANGLKGAKFSNLDFLGSSFLNGFADLVVTVPPFGIKAKKHFSDLNGDLLKLIGSWFSFDFYDYIDSQVASILSIILSLKTSGKAIIVVPDSILFSGKKDFVFIREFLIRQRLLKGVISLPNTIFRPFIGISSSILIIENDSVGRTDKVFLFDGSRYSNDDFEKQTNDIIKAYHKQQDGESSVMVDYDSIPFKNYDLSPKRYLLDSLTDANHTPISDLSESIYTGVVISKSNLNKVTGVPFIQVGDLIDGNGLNEIESARAEYFVTDEEFLTRYPRFIPDRAVLIAKVGSKLKPSLYKHISSALCNPNIIIIKTDENILLPEYLITQLQSEYVLKQIEAIRHNIGVPHFSKSDFTNVKIKILSIEEQRSFTSTFYGKQLVEVKAITDQQREDDLYNIIASLKHELKQPVSSLGLDLDSLKDFISNKIQSGEPLSWEEPIVELLPGQNVDDIKESILSRVMTRMISSVVTAQNTLSKTEEILNVGAGVFVPENILIKEFLITVIKPVFANNNCTIHVLGEEREITVDKYQIEILFKRLIENAIKHGFSKEVSRENNIINIRLSGKNAYKDFNEIIVENNGKPFPSEFDISKFQMVGQTANRYRGTGFGGFHIKRIIESHKGEIYLADKKEIGESQFKVRFKIYLP